MVVLVALLGGELEDRLHRVRRQRRIRLEHQRDRPGDDRRRHARAAQAQVRLADRSSAAPQARGGMRREQHARAARLIDSMPTPGATRSGLALRSIAEGPRELNAAIVVVRPIRRALAIARADRQHPRRVPRRGDPAVLRLPEIVAPEIACRGDDHDAGVDRAPGRQRERIPVVGLVHAGRDRQVDDADVERLAVARSRTRAPRSRCCCSRSRRRRAP